MPRVRRGIEVKKRVRAPIHARFAKQNGGKSPVPPDKIIMDAFLPNYEEENTIKIMKEEKEWMLQAEDDLISATALFDAGRYTHCVFFCHLALEKSLKAVYYRKFKKEPPRTHNLMRLIDDTELQADLPPGMFNLIKELASASVPTRYPEDIKRMNKRYPKSGTSRTLERSREAHKWINERLTK